MNRQDFLARVAAVESEYRIALLSVENLRAVASKDPAILRKARLTMAGLEACQQNLEPTYVVRLFAEFETPLRLYWRDARKRKSWNTIGAEALIEGVASYRRVPADVLRETQKVREFRNTLVHRSGREGVAALTLRQCRSSLCRFLSFLPLRW